MTNSTVEITGHSKAVVRLITGMHSFDRAFINSAGDIGYPQGKMTEIWGPTHIGKSTAIYGISSLLAKELNTNIVLADLEDFDPEFLKAVCSSTGFTGTIHSILEDTDEKTLDALIDSMNEDFGVGILDSVGAISPIAEREGDLGEANMGRRAKLMAAFSRKAIYTLRKSKDNKNIFLINHQHSPMGGFSKAPYAPGGETKGYLASIRIQMKRQYIKGTDTNFPDGSYVIEGKVVKNRWGLHGNTFNLFILSGKGLHLGMTALWDGFVLDKISKVRGVYKIGDQSFGKMKDILDEAQAGNDEFFQPFFDVLKGENDGT